MKSLFLSLIALALVACAGAPEQSAPPKPPGADLVQEDAFEQRLLEELKKLAPTRTDAPERDSDPIGEFRRAEQRQRELVAEIRRSALTNGTFPGEQLAELREVRDQLYDAAWRALIDGTTEPLPPELVAYAGGVR
ncbi:MAG: hypothetical protein IPM29_04465 [Planctomycetes bacterium]|nr:hypothetical protein [Planctomycetota bacterium]